MIYCLNFIDYPQHLHDEHADYPLAPESTIVTPDMLSQKQLDMLGVESKEDIKASKIKKLIPCLLYTSPSPRDATLSRMPSSA